MVDRLKRNLSELDEAAETGASIDAYPPAVRARMAAQPAGSVPKPGRQAPGAGYPQWMIDDAKRLGIPMEVAFPEGSRFAGNVSARDRFRDMTPEGSGGGGAGSQGAMPAMPRPKPARDPNVQRDTARNLEVLQRRRSGGDIAEVVGAVRDIISNPRRSLVKSTAAYAGFDPDGPAPAARPPAPGPQRTPKAKSPQEQAVDARRSAVLESHDDLYDATQGKALPAGVRRYDAGLEVPAEVYATYDDNGNRVYTDNAGYAGQRAGAAARAEGIPSRGLPQNDQSRLRAADLAAAPNQDREYTDAIATPRALADMRRNTFAAIQADPKLAADTALRDDFTNSFAEADRMAEIEAARSGTRPIDLRRRMEVAARGQNDLTFEQQLALRKDDRAERQLGANIEQAQATLAMQEMTAQQRADYARKAQTNAQFNQGAQLTEMLSKVDADGMPVYRPEQVAQLAAGLFEARDAGDQGAVDFFNTAPGRVLAGIMDQQLGKAAADSGNFAWDDGDVWGSSQARTGFGDVRLDDRGELYAMERPETFGIQGRAGFGSPRALARRLGIPEEAVIGRLQNGLQYRDPEDEE